MKRHYFVRGRRVEVEEVENVAAVRMSRTAPTEAPAPGLEATFGAPAEDLLRNSLARATGDPLADFRNAGWVFVRPNTDTREALARTAPPPPRAERVGKVLVQEDGTPAIVTQRLNVQIDPTLGRDQAEAVLKEKGLVVLQRLGFAPNLYETRATGWDDALSASVDLQQDGRFVFAEPSLVECIPGRAIPTDPDFDRQWQWPVVGAPAAWDTTLGAGVRVAVIDNGFDPGHEDLAPGLSNLSGYFDDSGAGASAFVPGIEGMPGGSHGTFCAGMVGARQGNGKGGVGAAPECELVLIACLGDQVGTQTTLARAVAYAIDSAHEVPGASGGGADILVSSLGPNIATWRLTSTLDLALNAAPGGRGGKGLPIFWAASNGRDVDVMLDEVVSHPNVIAVVRSRRDDTEDNGARGPAVDLIAPGVDVYSTLPENRYGTGTGTSYAAPCAAGCAALALSVDPSMTGDELRDLMLASADKIGGATYDDNGHSDDYGFGRVDAEQAVALAQQRVRTAGGPGTVPGGTSLPAGGAADEDIIRIRVTAPSRDALRRFAEETDADLGCRAVARRTDEGFVTDAYLPESRVAAVEGQRGDLRVERVENFSEASRQRRQEVSQGNRFASRDAVPRGLGRKE